ncbi:hypothetical protein ABPG75_006298 [Micractinium tetrahymenae]
MSLLAIAVPPPAGFSIAGVTGTASCDNDGERQICIDRGIGLWVEQFDYRTTNNGFTLIYNGVQLADVRNTWDSAPYQWPIIRSQFAYRGACACCDLCRAQPNPSAADTSAKCKEWSYRPADRACRLFIDFKGQNQASVALLSSTAYQRNWTSGEAAVASASAAKAAQPISPSSAKAAEPLAAAAAKTPKAIPASPAQATVAQSSSSS